MPPGDADLLRRRAGVCLHLTSLPGRYGIGDLGAPAYRFMDWMQAQDLSVWQFLPLVPTGYGNSPYQPLSVFAGNPLLIDLDGLVEWGLLRADEADRCRGDADSLVDYERVTLAKSSALRTAAERFQASPDSGLEAELEAFIADNDSIWLGDFAAFAVARALNAGAAWPAWATGDREAHVDELERRHAAELERVKLVQFFFDRQWRSLRVEARRRGIMLFGDVPIYMALDCAEAWSHPELLYLDEAFRPVELAGVPPDYFSADGQLWGNPVYRWDVHAGDGFSWWIARLRHALSGTDLVRLDHFRGFDEFWSVPTGASTAREGHWNRGPRHAFFDAVVAELGAAPFVAEDLGIITASVTALRKAYALPGMQVLQFLVEADDFDIHRIEEDCVCYTGTHDNDTTEGWFAGEVPGDGEVNRDRQARLARNLEGTQQKIYKTMIYRCFSSSARIAMAPLQDYLGLGTSARLNTPGRTEGNWRWRVTEPQLDGRDADYVPGLVRETGRS